MPDVVLKAEHVTKRFGGITALENAELELYKGEVHALVGANGAGKSTLIKIITGAYPKDEGEIYLDGKQIEVKSTFDAREKGISAVFLWENCFITILDRFRELTGKRCMKKLKKFWTAWE